MRSFNLSILFVVLTTCLHAQTGLQLGLRLNPEFTGLLNKSDFDAGAELDYKSHFGYLSFGVGGIFNINNNLGVGADLLFSREGQAFEGNFSGSPADSNAYSSVVQIQALLNDTVLSGNYEALAELNYIKLPLMLSLTSDNSRPFFFTLLIGPQFNFLQGVAQEVNGEDLEYPNTSIEPKDLYKAVTLDGMMALGGAYNLTSHIVLSARVRFDYGFNDVEKKDVMISTSGSDPVHFYSADRKATHNVTAGLMVGLDFKL